MSERRNPWTTGEIKLLREIYATSGPADLQRQIPRHSLGSIYLMAHRHRIKKNKTCRVWCEITAAHDPVFDFGRSI